MSRSTWLGLEADTASAADVLSRFDADKNGKLEIGEFRALVKQLKGFQLTTSGSGGAVPQPAAAGAVELKTDDILRVFQHYDRDGSGDIDVGELREALNALNMPVDTEGAVEVLNRFDAGKTGRLNYDEFRRLANTLQNFQQGQPTHGD